MTLKLDSITFDHAPRIPGVRAGDMIQIICEQPTGPLVGWRVILRGNSVFFASPKGWRPGVQPHDFAPDGPQLMHEVPRAHVFMHWSGDAADIDAVITKGKFETPPFGQPVAVRPVVEGKGILAQLDPSQLGDL